MKKAFTILELLVVIAIIAILAIVAVPNFIGRIQEAKEARDLAELINVEKACGLYYLEHGDYPSLQPGAPRFGVPGNVDFSKIYPTYLSSLPHFSYWWIDYNGRVYYTEYPPYMLDNEEISITDGYKATVYDQNNNPVGTILTGELPLADDEYAVIEEVETTKLFAAITNEVVEPEGHPEDPDFDGYKPIITDIVMTPASNLKYDTNIEWDYTYTDADNDTIQEVEWVGKESVYAPGNYTVSLRIKDSQGKWSNTFTKTFDVETVHVDYVGITGESVSINRGETYSLETTISPPNAFNKDIVWISADTAIATVDNGTVTALSKGTTTITATSVDSGISDTVSIEVTVPVGGVSIDKTTLTVPNSGTAKLVATVTPPEANNTDISWTCSDNTILTVDQNGNITPLKNGTATVTATSPSSGYSASCTVTVVTPVIGITISNTSLSVALGTEATLTATVQPFDSSNTGITWSSSNTGIFTVSPTGKITPVSKGTATATAKSVDGNFTATCSVEVVVPVTSIGISSSSLTLNYGSTATLTATVSPATANNKAVTWSSSNTAVATVDSVGKVTPVNKGTSIIKATSADGGFQASCTVTVLIPVTGINISKTTLSLPVGSSSTLTASVVPSTANNTGITWSSNNSSVISVNSSGLVSAPAAGTAIITAKSVDGNFTATCTVTSTVPVSGITLNKSIDYCQIGTSITLTPTITPSTASIQDIVWTSSDVTKATVAGGVVTSLTPGSAIITATTADGSFSASCTVEAGYFAFSPANKTIGAYNAAGGATPVIPSKIIGVDVLIIANGTFLGDFATVSSVTIPTSIKTIQYDAFYGLTKLKSIVIPNSVTNMGINAFFATGLTSVTLPTGLITLESHTFASCPYLATVVIPTNIRTISQYAFSSSPVTKITIGAGVAISTSAGTMGSKGNFKTVYDAGGKLAGTYNFNGTTWVKQ